MDTQAPNSSAPRGLRSTGAAPDSDVELLMEAVPYQPREVLVVDAEDPYRRKTRTVLVQLGHAVQVARDVAEALKLLEVWTPDLIVADLNVPGRGSELFKTVRELSHSAHVPVLFTCRGGHPLEIMRGVPLDPRAVLRKPFTARRMGEHLQPTLRRIDRIEAFGNIEHFSGSFLDLSLPDLLGVITRYRRSGQLSIWTSDRKQQATSRFLEGRLISARSGWLEGTEVFTELLLWENAYYELRPSPVEPPLVEAVSEAQWRELLASLVVLERGQLNPFPRPSEAPLLPLRADTTTPQLPAALVRLADVSPDRSLPAVVRALPNLDPVSMREGLRMLSETRPDETLIDHSVREPTDELKLEDRLGRSFQRFSQEPSEPVLHQGAESTDELKLADRVASKKRPAAEPHHPDSQEERLPSPPPSLAARAETGADADEVEPLSLEDVMLLDEPISEEPPEIIYHDDDDNTMDLAPDDIIEPGLLDALAATRGDVEDIELPFSWESDESSHHDTADKTPAPNR
ncbi:MAG: response regulator [Myxococcota bacterium]